MSALVAAVRQAWVPSYFPIVTIPGVVLWFKLNEKTGFTDKFILFTNFKIKKNVCRQNKVQTMCICYQFECHGNETIILHMVKFIDCFVFGLKSW